jgi:hypothetical protein
MHYYLVGFLSFQIANVTVSYSVYFSFILCHNWIQSSCWFFLRIFHNFFICILVPLRSDSNNIIVVTNGCESKIWSFSNNIRFYYGLPLSSCIHNVSLCSHFDCHFPPLIHHFSQSCIMFLFVIAVVLVQAVEITAGFKCSYESIHYLWWIISIYME